MPMHKLAWFIAELLQFYAIVVLVNALLSWFVVGTQNTHVKQIYLFTGRFVDPVLSPIRNLLEPVSRNFGIDISPFVLIILLQILARMLR